MCDTSMSAHKHTSCDSPYLCRPSLLLSIISAGVGFECVSRGEIDLVLSHFPEIDRTRILFTPNFAPKEEYAYALQVGMRTPGISSSLSAAQIFSIASILTKILICLIID